MPRGKNVRYPHTGNSALPMTLFADKPSLHGTIRIPPSKSHTIRALLCAALAETPSCIESPLMSADILTAIEVLRQLGVGITEIRNRPLVLKVTPPVSGILSFIDNADAEIRLDLGNSGSLLYFLGVLLAAAQCPVSLTGDSSLQSRPVEPLLAVYRQAGLNYSACAVSGSRTPPVRLCGPLRAGTFRLTGPFSQPVTGLLLTAPLLKGLTEIFFDNAGERPYLRMTCEWLRTAGIEVFSRDECYFKIAGCQRYSAFSKTIAGDWSSALFPLTAAILCNAALTLTNLDPLDVQGDSQAVHILREMGADIRCNPERRTVTVHPAAASLHGGSFDCADIPDAVPALAAAAAFCEGETFLFNTGVCRFKECDRLHAITEELSKFGAVITQGADFLRIDGKGGGGLHPAGVWSHGDHRIAMMLACTACGIAARSAGSCNSDAQLPLKDGSLSYIEDFECVSVSYPDFIADMNTAGAAFRCGN